MTINSTGSSTKIDNMGAAGIRSAASSIKIDNVSATIESASAGGSVSISSLSSRIAKAEEMTNAANSQISASAMKSKVSKNLQAINYPLDTAHKAKMASEEPLPLDDASKASAEAATRFMDNVNGPNPFAGLSRDQLATVYNDESGTFTTNEKYAAYRESYNQEQAWRTAFVAQAKNEYETTGKQTESFRKALDHFNEIPKLEQVLYPDNYASALQEKIDLDYNYFTNMAHDRGADAEESLANLSKKNSELNKTFRIPDIFGNADKD